MPERNNRQTADPSDLFKFILRNSIRSPPPPGLKIVEPWSDLLPADNEIVPKQPLFGKRITFAAGKSGETRAVAETRVRSANQ